MSNAKVSFSAVFAAIGATANAATTAVNAMSDGVNMGASYIREAAINQKIEQEFDRRDFLENLLNERSIERLKKEAEIATLCADPAIAAKFAEARNRYADIVAKYSAQ